MLGKTTTIIKNSISNSKYNKIGFSFALLSLGLTMIFFSGIAYLFIYILFALMLFVDGVINIIDSYRKRAEIENWKSAVWQGIFSIILSVFILYTPIIANYIILYTIATAAIIIGYTKFTTSYRQIRSEKKKPDTKINLLEGLISFLLGIWMFFSPFIAGLSMITIGGIYLTFMSFKLLFSAVRK